MTKEDFLDEIDRAILRELQQNARISNAEMSRRINLSAPAIHSRIRNLEEQGFIQKYAVVLNRQKLGWDILSFIQVQLKTHQTETVEAFRSYVLQKPGSVGMLSISW